MTRGSFEPSLNTTVAQFSEMHHVEWSLRARCKFACAPTRRTRQGDVRFPEVARREDLDNRAKHNDLQVEVATTSKTSGVAEQSRLSEKVE